MAELTPQDTTAARQTLQQLSDGTQVEPATVGLSEWWKALQQWVINNLDIRIPTGDGEGLAGLFEALAWILVPVLLVLLGVMAWRALRPRTKDADEAAEVSALPEGPHPDTAEGAWLALQQVMTADPRHGALLLWKWTCLRLTEQERGTWHPEATWREFVATVPAEDTHRAALTDLGRALQRLAYGPAEPTTDDLHGLLPTAQEVAA